MLNKALVTLGKPSEDILRLTYLRNRFFDVSVLLLLRYETVSVLSHFTTRNVDVTKP